MTGRRALTPQAWPDTVDLLVIGSGVAGLSAAVTAAAKGLSVLMVEKTGWLGGSSAWSGGTLWLPGCGLPGQPADDTRQARRYLRHELGQGWPDQAGMVRTYLAGARAAVSFFSRLPRGALAFEVDAATPDFHELPGSATGGRIVRARACDARSLGPLLDTLRPPLPEFGIGGLGIESGDELLDYQRAWRFWRHPKAAWRVTARAGAGLLDRLRHGRSMRLVNGQALVARLLAAAQAQATAVDIRTGCSVTRLLSTDGRVTGAVLRTPAGVRELRARAGVVLATGGFAHDADRLAAGLSPLRHGHGLPSAAPCDLHGDGASLAEALRGRGHTQPPTAATRAGRARTWVVGVPVSRYRRRSGAIVTYPHFIDRAKPGVIAVGRDGCRWSNESVSYHDFGSAWIQAAAAGGPDALWLVCDLGFMWRYGLGAVKPFWLLQPWALWTGYLKASMTIEGLARSCGIDARGLQQTIDSFNAHAPDDPAHGRGRTAFERHGGDPDASAHNPCVAPIARAPFYAVRLAPGCLGTLAGIATDRRARVLDANGQAIAGLYACGNDMAHPLGGCYPGNGVTLGAALIFGHLAGWDASEAAARCVLEHALCPPQGECRDTPWGG